MPKPADRTLAARELTTTELILYRRCGCDAGLTVEIPVLDAPELLAHCTCHLCRATWAVESGRELEGRR